MTIEEYEALALKFKTLAAELRQLGEDYPSAGCNAVLFSANLAASYSDLAANYVEGRIEAIVIAQVAMEERHAYQTHHLSR